MLQQQKTRGLQKHRRRRESSPPPSALLLLLLHRLLQRQRAWERGGSRGAWREIESLSARRAREIESAGARLASLSLSQVREIFRKKKKVKRSKKNKRSHNLDLTSGSPSLSLARVSCSRARVSTWSAARKTTALRRSPAPRRPPRCSGVSRWTCPSSRATGAEAPLPSRPVIQDTGKDRVTMRATGPLRSTGRR